VSKHYGREAQTNIQKTKHDKHGQISKIRQNRLSKSYTAEKKRG
jgi:hypothetical protein